MECEITIKPAMNILFISIPVGFIIPPGSDQHEGQRLWRQIVQLSVLNFAVLQAGHIYEPLFLSFIFYQIEQIIKPTL